MDTDHAFSIADCRLPISRNGSFKFSVFSETGNSNREPRRPREISRAELEDSAPKVFSRISRISRFQRLMSDFGHRFTQIKHRSANLRFTIGDLKRRQFQVFSETKGLRPERGCHCGAGAPGMPFMRFMVSRSHSTRAAGFQWADTGAETPPA